MKKRSTELDEEDDEQLNEFLPLAGAIAGGKLAGGAGIAGRMAGSLLGRAAGNAAQDTFADDEEDYELEERWMNETKKPSAGMTKKEKSSLVKKAQAGKDIGKPGKGFEKVAKAAGGGEKGKKIAAAAMWKNAAKESVEQIDEYADSKAYGVTDRKERKEPTLNLPKIAQKPASKSSENDRGMSSSMSMTRGRNYMEDNKASVEEATDQDFDADALKKGKSSRAARDNPAQAVAMAKKSPAAKNAKAELEKVRDYGKRDAQMESWGKELNALLEGKITEGLTITTSTGNQGTPDSVSINASDKDVGMLMAVLRNAGLAGGSALSAEVVDSVPQAAGYNGTEYDGAGSPAITVKNIGDQAGTTADSPDSETGDGEVPAYGDNAEIHREVPVMAMPLGMAMSRNPDDETGEHIAVEPATQDEVISDLESNADETSTGADASGDGALSFIKQMLGHGASQRNSQQEPVEIEVAEEDAETVSAENQMQDEADNEETIDEAEMDEGNEFSGALAKAKAAGAKEFEVDGKSYPVKEESEDDHAKCESCGDTMTEGHDCDADYKDELTEWANSQGKNAEDEQFKTDLEFMTKLISGGLNNMKQDQTTLGDGPLRVKTSAEQQNPELSMAAQLKKLSGIN